MKDLGGPFCSLSGQRLVSYEDMLFQSAIRLYDFNPYTVRKFHAELSDKAQVLPTRVVRTAVTKKSVYRTVDTCFRYDVVTELPYFVCMMGIKPELGSMLWMDESRISYMSVRVISVLFNHARYIAMN